MRTRDLTQGSPMKLLVIFSLPVLLGNLFQQLYNIADIMIVGHTLGDGAFAAVGAAGSVFNLLMGFINGLANGFSIVTARYFGAKQPERVTKTIAFSMVLGLLLAGAFLLAGALGSGQLLRLLRTPADIFNEAYRYLIVLVGCLFFTMLYNLAAGFLRALGNNVLPLVFLIIAVFTNIGLDLLFVAGLHWGVAGAAWATGISQALSAVLCWIYIALKCPQLHTKRADFRYERGLYQELLSTGFSIAMANSIITLGTMLMQGVVNAMGTLYIGAQAAAKKIVNMLMLPMITIGISMATFTSQNYGAGKIRRIHQGIRSALLLQEGWALAMTALVLLFGEQLVRGITGTTDAAVIENTVLYMRINVPFFAALGPLFVYRQALLGIGRSRTSLVSGILELATRVGGASLIAPVFGYAGVCATEPTVWVICVIFLIVMFYLDGRIRHAADG